MTKKGLKNTSSVTLRLFQGTGDSQGSFEVVKVSGNPTTIPIDELLGSQELNTQEPPNEKPETFDGYFPDDGYDYTRHLREINQKRFIPATRVPVDDHTVAENPEVAEVLAALDDENSSNFDELDETFANKLGPIDERTRIGMLWGEDQVDDYLTMPTDKLMAIQSRILSRESEAKEISDEAFGDFLAKEFADSQIGALTPEEVDVNDEDSHDGDEEVADEDDPEQIRQDCVLETKRLIAMNESLQCSVLDVDEDLSDIVIVPVSNVPEWDCESVLSTRSNIYNHPGLITRPKRESRKPSPQVDIIPEEPVSETEADTPEPKCVSTLRRKDETPEERKERKKAIKEFQREQRASRKSEEKQRREAVNHQKKLIATAKHNNYGDIPQGIPKFAI